MEVEMPRLPKFRRMPGRILIERRKRKPMFELSAYFSGCWEATAQNERRGVRFGLLICAIGGFVQQLIRGSSRSATSVTARMAIADVRQEPAKRSAHHRADS